MQGKQLVWSSVWPKPGGHSWHVSPSALYVFVGHWWQGRLVEGVGLMALFFGGFWLADAKK